MSAKPPCRDVGGAAWIISNHLRRGKRWKGRSAAGRAFLRAEQKGAPYRACKHPKQHLSEPSFKLRGHIVSPKMLTPRIFNSLTAASFFTGR